MVACTEPVTDWQEKTRGWFFGKLAKRCQKTEVLAGPRVMLEPVTNDFKTGVIDGAQSW
jgi:hypothetical protein